MQESLIIKKTSKSILATNQNLRIIIFEIIGTFILTFGISCTQYIPPLHVKVDNPFHDIFISFSLYLAIVMCAPFTGGHFNPSVTFGFFFLKSEKMSVKRLLSYLVAQFIGAGIGVILAKQIFDCEVTPYDSSLSDTSTLFGNGFGQFLGGFLFILMILIVVNPSTTFTNEASWVQLFIPCSLFVARSFSYHIGGVNPAVISMFQIESIISQSIPAVTFWYIVILGLFSIAGSFTASMFYQRIYAPTIEKVMA